MKSFTPALAATGLMVALACPLTATAEERVATLAVSATGTAVVVPDMATLSLSVVREAKTAREALDANNKAMADVMAAMVEAGIAERDLQTSQFHIQPKYKRYKPSYNGDTKPPEIVGYQVSNRLTVRVRDLSKVGAVLDRSVTLGVNSGGGITFSTSRPEAALEEARKNAVEKAMAKARVLTETAGVELERIITITEQNRGRPPMRTMGRMAEAAMMEEASVPVAAGENTYEVTINVTWELSQ